MEKSMRNVLLTGASGFYGRAVARGLLDAHRDTHVWALVRPSEGPPCAGRVELARIAKNPRFHLLPGDVTLPGLLAAGAPRPPAFDACFHLAADTDFRESQREQTFRVNVEGTYNVISYLRGLPGRPRLFHVSTAYVQWQGREFVAEELLSDGPYTNPYEASKHAAEKVVAESGLDWVMLRPSILVGDSRTGEACSDKMPYGGLVMLMTLRDFLASRGIGSGGPYRLLCRENTRRNFICVDDATRLTVAVAAANPPSGTIVHIANPVPTNMKSLTQAALDCLGIDFVRLTPEIDGALSIEERMLAKGLHLYSTYMLESEPLFDLTRLRAVVGDAVVDSVLPITTERMAELFRKQLARDQRVRDAAGGRHLAAAGQSTPTSR
jgi:nucleoside-diphosphate-sugar epimerase